MKNMILSFVAALATAHAAFGEEHRAEPAMTLTELTEVFLTMPQGDPAKGAELHQTYWCASCHGPDGVSQSRNYPSVAGQVPTYTYKTLLDYRDGRRMEGTGRAAAMAAAVATLTDQNLADLAAYYASGAAPRSGEPVTVSDPTLVLVRHGDPQRLLTPCASCHGVTGAAGIRPETPALAGREADYLQRTLLAYRAGARSNDTAKGMRFFAEQLSDAEIAELAAYYAAISD